MSMVTMTPDEAAARSKELLDMLNNLTPAQMEPAPIGWMLVPIETLRSLLSGYEADQKCLYDMETYMQLGSAKYMAIVLKNHLARMRGPKPSGEGGDEGAM